MGGAADRMDVVIRGFGTAFDIIGLGTEDSWLEAVVAWVSLGGEVLVSSWMFRMDVGPFRFRIVVSTVVVRNAAPSGSLFVAVFGLSVDAVGDCCVVSSSSLIGGVKGLSLPKIFEDDCFREELTELDFDSSLNNPRRPSSLE